MLVPLGRVVATPAVLDILTHNRQSVDMFLRRHEQGDWGCLTSSDCRLNNLAYKHGDRILSAYLLLDKTKIYIITEADRSSTTVLLADEY